MLRIKTLVVMALMSSAALVNAQTGPTGPANPSVPPQTGPAGQPNMLNADRLTNYLRGQGHTVEHKRFANGGITLMCKIQLDGWRYEMEIEFTPDQKTLTIIVPVGQPNSQFSGAQLLALMKSSAANFPTHYLYREADRRLCLVDPMWGTVNWTEANFQQTMNRVLKIVRDTYPLWDSSRWPVNGQGPTASNPAAPAVPTGSNPPAAPVVPTAQPAAPVNPSTPAAPAVAQSIGNGTFVGSETLGSYGRLEFRFSGVDQVVMVDKDGQTPGTYSVQGNTVTIRFSYSNDGQVVYTGTINGPSISGTATNGSSNWTFSVSK